MWEPRGHKDMYGAILVAQTELTSSGAADMGVLFCHNEGYSTSSSSCLRIFLCQGGKPLIDTTYVFLSVCGHATLALGRFLVDTQDTLCETPLLHDG